MAQASIEIPITCREGPERCAACAECVRERLLKRPGIRGVSITQNDGEARITLEYETEMLAISELEREIRAGGGCFAPEWGQAILPVDGMVSPQAEQIIEAALNRLPGVMATASYAAQLVRVEFDRRRCPVPEIISALGRIGFSVRADAFGDSSAPPPSGTRAPETASPRRAPPAAISSLLASPELLMPLLGGLLLIGAYLIHTWSGPQPLRVVLLVASFLCSARYTGLQTLRAIRFLRFDVDVLMYIAAAGAIAIEQYEEGALLLVLFGLGTAGENLAMDKARRAIKALAELAPETAIRLEPDGCEREVPVARLAAGDCLVLRPFERIAADGEVIQGSSVVDESPITGESIPVEKTAGSGLLAGTMNGGGRIVMRVTRGAGETKLARIIQLVSEAQTTKSRTELLTDRVQRWYVPGVLAATCLLIFVPSILGQAAWSVWFYRAMAFLTAASPCALAIGTPAAVLSGIARAARGGVLIKGGVHLENLGQVKVMAFDKTGTLTRGRAEVTEVISLDGGSGDELLRLAAAIERYSQHPLASAIVVESKVRGLSAPAATRVRELAGAGIMGEVDDRIVRVGRALPEHLSDGTAIGEGLRRLESKGRTCVVVSVDGGAIGIIGLADHPRERARAVLATLKRMGIRRTLMLTGDNPRVAAAVAEQVGVDEFCAGLLPEDKLNVLRELAREHGRVAMVGDGTNDAPALASATVGIAMGGAGTDVAMETADVALMADDLGKLPEAIGLSRFSRRIILQNLVLALGVIAVMAPAAALGGASLGLAVICHEGSTVLVVLNALRLLVYRMER